jgi:hypothetical protein
MSTFGDFENFGVANIRDSGTAIYTAKVNYSSTSAVQIGYVTSGSSLSALSNTVPMTWASGDHVHAIFRVPIVGLSSGQVLKSNQTPWFIDARLDGANQSLGVINVAAFTEITNAGWTLTPVTGSQPVGIMCSSTNAAATPTTSTSVCGAGLESVGINFAIPYPGNYEVCFTGSTFYEFDSSDTILNNFQLVETPTNAQTLTQSSNVYAHTGNAGGNTTGTNANNRSDYTTCANFNFGSAGIKGIRLMYNQTVAGTPNNVIFLASTTDKRPKFSVKQLTVPYPMPILVGSVTSNSSGAERIERATILCGAASAITSQSGSWISSVGNLSSGNCTITLASGIFSSSPSCTISGNVAGSNMATISQILVSSATSLTARCHFNSAGTETNCGADTSMNVICMGSR